MENNTKPKSFSIGKKLICNQSNIEKFSVLLSNLKLLIPKRMQVKISE